MSIPANITANVGLSGGAPTNPQDTAAYLTQLQQSLNGFTGSTAAALNYLLQSAVSTPVTRIVQISSLKTTFTLPGTGGYAMAAMSNSNGSLSPALFTPAHTGRVAVIGNANWFPGVTYPAGSNNSCNAIINFGTGTTSYAQGATGPTGTQEGLGSILAQQIGALNTIVQNRGLMPMCLLSGLSTTTQYWLDIGFSYTASTSGEAGEINACAIWIIEC